jgi:hypothetical protein
MSAEFDEMSIAIAKRFKVIASSKIAEAEFVPAQEPFRFTFPLDQLAKMVFYSDRSELSLVLSTMSASSLDEIFKLSFEASAEMTGFLDSFKVVDRGSYFECEARLTPFGVENCRGHYATDDLVISTSEYLM